MSATPATVSVRLSTNLGDITLKLDSAKAPKTVANFVDYVKAGHYDGLVFHRVIKGFMIQGGGYDGEYNQKRTRAPIENEAKNGLKNRRGTVAMARTSDPHSASSQFFINHSDNDFLDYPGQDGWGYAVFGEVSDGLDVVDKIAATPTGSARPFGRDVPTTQIVIKSAAVL
jgi:cyclophilin family peptidyl-prolyl cis-trans isomerase